MQETHTGSVDVYISIEEEQQLAAVLEARSIAKQGMADLAETDPEAVEQLTRQYNTLFDAAGIAERKLIETNLRLAAYYARASVNIWTSKKQNPSVGQAAVDQGIIIADVPEIADEKRFSRSGRPGKYSDIRKLHSPYADLEDRIQIANVALVEAAQTFRPMTDKNGRPVTFSSHAGYRIHAALAKYAKSEEMPGWYIVPNAVDQIYKSRKYPEEYTPERREELERADLGRNTVPLDGLSVEKRLNDDEFREDNDTLEPADIIAGIESYGLLQGFFDDEATQMIQEVLSTLSEREKTVVTLRFGLYDSPQSTLEEIGAVLGVSRERVRQIESKAMAKLRHRTGHNPKWGDLINYLDTDEPWSLTASNIPSVVAGVSNIKTGQILGRKAVHHVSIVVSEAVDTRDEKKESWQAYPGEAWDAPLRRSPRELQETYDRTLAEFSQLLFRAAPYTFQRSFAEDVGSSHPAGLVNAIEERLDKNLTASHVEEFWNTHLETFTGTLANRLGGDFDLDRVSKLFSRLLADYMSDESSVELVIPESLGGQLNSLGEGLEHGRLSIVGNAGDFLGYQASGLSQIELHGSAGDYAGAGMEGYAHLEIHGNAGNFVGGELKGNARVVVKGSVQSNCGESMSGSEAVIEVKGDAGPDVGHGAERGTIQIRGIADSVAVKRTFRGEITAGRIKKTRIK